MSAPPPTPSPPIVSLEDLKALLPTRPAAIVLGPAIASALSGRSVILKDLLQSGLRLATEHSVLNKPQYEKLLSRLESPGLIEHLKLGPLLEPFLKSKKGLLADWLRDSVGGSRVVNPAAAGPVLKAAQDGFLVASATYDGLLEEATGLPAITWLDFRSPSQLLSPPTVFRPYGSWSQPESIVRALPGASGAELHRRAIDTFLNDPQLIVTVGAAVPFGEDPLVEGLKRRGDSLPGIVLCREDEIQVAREFLAKHLPWFRIAPYPGGADALPEVLTSLFGKAVLPQPDPRNPHTKPASLSSTPSQEIILPAELHALAESPDRLARFMARLTLRHREGLALLETLEPGCLIDTLRPSNVLAAPTPIDFAGRVLALEKDLGSSFEPPPLWLAWMQNVCRAELNRLGQELISLARHATPPPPPPAPSVSPSEPTRETPQPDAPRGPAVSHPIHETDEPTRPPSRAAVKALRRKARGTPGPPPPETKSVLAPFYQQKANENPSPPPA